MKTKSTFSGAALVLIWLLAIWFPVSADHTMNDKYSSPGEGSQPEQIYATVITVDSGRDIDTSLSTTCLSATPCTLRRAIVQARNIPDVDRPVLIQFNIPEDVNEGYDSTLDIWKIQVLATTDTSVFRRLNGQITIDGSTQPGGRASGPKIFIVGPGTGQKDGLIVGDTAGDNDHIIRGLGFQNLKTHMYVNTNGNLIEGNWFGLSEAGTLPVLRDDDPTLGSGNTGVALLSASQNNTIQENVFLGIAGVAAAIRGENNTFSNNYVGTQADGTVTGKQTEPSLICTPVDWLGGGGISLADQNNIIVDNIFAGLRLEVSIWSLQPDTIRVGGGESHQIRNNKIGVDSANYKIGVCGRGIYLSDAPEAMQVGDNVIIEPGLSAISLHGLLANGNAWSGNIIEKTGAWPEIEGAAKPEDAIQLGTSLPDTYENFTPAKITQINGVTVSGTSGTGSACPNCTVEIFLDDKDSVKECLEPLAIATANASGNWTATLPAELTAQQGLRTVSTTAQYNTIPNMQAGTSTALSELYVAGYEIFLPLIE